MAIDDQQPIAGDSMDHGQMTIIGSIGTNVVMTRVRKMISVRSHTENIVNHHRIIGYFSKTGMSKQ